MISLVKNRCYLYFYKKTVKVLPENVKYRGVRWDTTVSRKSTKPLSTKEYRIYYNVK